MTSAEPIEQRLDQIEARNRRVEGDKAWEGSWFRRITIAVVTYLVVLSYTAAIGVKAPYLAAVVPVVGFLLSTLTLPAVKRAWLKRQK